MTLEFKELDLADLPVFKKVLSQHPQRICCFTPGSLFAWKIVYGYTWTMLGSETFFISFQPLEEYERHFFQPVGVFNSDDQSTLITFFRSLRYPVKIFNVGEEFIQKNEQFVKNFDILKEDGLSNYIYNASESAALRGTAYATKRKMITRASKLYQWSAHALTNENYLECMDILNKWYSFDPGHNEYRNSESIAASNAIRNFPDLSYQGVLIRVAGKPAAFSLFAQLNPDTACISFMKSDRDYKGLFEIVHCEASKAICRAGFTLINGEEDWDIPGIRHSKVSYRPSEMLPSYILTLKT
jgi:hypothetical protein